MKVSIVVPVYNNEKYLNQCLDSICSQTLKDIEIILVNDGSTDSSPDICEEYAKLDNRIRVVHNKNAGMGNAYNTGIKLATGEYVGFIESDDFIDKHTYEDLYHLASKNNADIVKADWFNYTENYCEKSPALLFSNSYDVIAPSQIPWILTFQATVWSAIYKRDFIINKNIYFLETPGASYQDVGFTYKALTQAESIILSPNAYYYYRQDNENASIKSKGKLEAIFNEYREVDRFLNENPSIKEWANTDKLVKQYIDYNWNFNRIDDSLKAEFIELYANDFKRYDNQGELLQTFWDRVDQQNLKMIINQIS